MKSAYVVINEARVEVQASEVSHADYKKIFECPECHAVLTFRQGHYRGSSWVGPSFVHGADAPQACSRRVDFGIVEDAGEEINFTAKGQSEKKLGKALMTCLMYHRTGHISSIDAEFPQLIFGGFQDTYIKRQIDYNKGCADRNDKQGLRYSSHPNRETKVYPDITLLIDAAYKILNSPQSEHFFKEKVKKRKEEFTADASVCKFFEARYPNARLEESIDLHCDQLQGISMFLSQGCQKDTRKKFLDWILFADPQLPISLSFFKDYSRYSHDDDLDKRSLQNIFDEVSRQREPHLRFLSQFMPECLESINNDPEASLEVFYKGINSPLTVFINFILINTFETIEVVDWSWLPYFYVQG